MITVDMCTGYAHYASYFINADASGLTNEEQTDADQFAEYCGGLIVDCSKEHYYNGNGGDISEKYAPNLIHPVICVQLLTAGFFTHQPGRKDSNKQTT